MATGQRAGELGRGLLGCDSAELGEAAATFGGSCPWRSVQGKPTACLLPDKYFIMLMEQVPGGGACSLGAHGTPLPVQA